MKAERDYRRYCVHISAPHFNAICIARARLMHCEPLPRLVFEKLLLAAVYYAFALPCYLGYSRAL